MTVSPTMLDIDPSCRDDCVFFSAGRIRYWLLVLIRYQSTSNLCGMPLVHLSCLRVLLKGAHTCCLCGAYLSISATDSCYSICDGA